MALKKADIVDSISNHVGFTRKKSVETIETLLEVMKKTLESGEDILISGFGKFRVKEKRERRGRNPATGDDLMLRPRRVVTFKCSGKLRKKIDGKSR
ncbi:integration host factor subunit alpha [Thermodesulfobacteriota bacterium]